MTYRTFLSSGTLSFSFPIIFSKILWNYNYEILKLGYSWRNFQPMPLVFQKRYKCYSEMLMLDDLYYWCSKLCGCYPRDAMISRPTVLAVAKICQSVRPTQSGIVSKRLVGIMNRRHSSTPIFLAFMYMYQTAEGNSAGITPQYTDHIRLYRVALKWHHFTFERYWIAVFLTTKKQVRQVALSKK